jgi:SNF2 family DNA or RNA helicase
MSEKNTGKVPYHRKPTGMDMETWQTELRKQFAIQQNFKIKNIGNHPYFSDFEVFNPLSNRTYKVSIRDNIKSTHFCSCPDFTINQLGTCKHIEYLLAYFEKYKKYQKYIGKNQKHDYSSLSIHYGQERKIRLKKGDNISSFENEEHLFDREGFLISDKINELEAFIRNAKKTDTSFRVYQDVLETIKHYNKTRQREEKVAKLFPKGIDSDIFANLINGTLYPFQKEGVIRILEKGRLLLADDMGLGKTIQAIAAITIFINHFDVNKILIICPTSLKYQWKREIQKFSGKEALVVEGLIHKRKILYHSPDTIKIISYGAAKNDIDLINSWNPQLVILDEAQRIKNWKTKTAQSIKKIESEYALVITGTPLENRIDELHSIVEYIDRYRLGPLYLFLHQHQVLDENGKLKGYKNLRTINQTLENILLRRTKKEIADQLPNRIDKNFFVELTPQQRTDHDSYYDGVAKLVTKWIRTGYLSEEERNKLLALLSCMRMVCDSTYILDTNTNYGDKIYEITRLVEEIIESPGNKIVIFSQWKKMFELLIKELKKRNISHVYLNGDVPARHRKIIIEKFQEDPGLKVFLSTDAGGVGVNLQRANVLINIDLPWNPAVLEQRIGRIYRLGQKKHINVFNFVAKSSIEHRILYLLDFKKSVFTGVIEEEGKDEVMLEGFLESVKALTEVNIDEIDNVQNRASFKSYQETDFAKEANAPYIDGAEKKNNTEPEEYDKKTVFVKTKKVKGLFFKKMIKKVKAFFFQ